MSELHILAPSRQHECELKSVFSAYPYTPFSGILLDFVQCFSERLLKDVACKQKPELIALGFWLRKSNISQLNSETPNGIRKALGTVLHFTPANVDSMFIYSWICSLLMGNKNIIRVSSAESEAKEILLATINQLFSIDRFLPIAKCNVFIRYPKDSLYTAELSKGADARVIWGGDESVKLIKSVAAPPKCRDISFADRYSAVLINGNELREQCHVSELAGKLWRDTEPHDQQACSSPRLVFWLGDKTHQSVLFNEMNNLAMSKNSALSRLNNHLVTTQMIQSKGLGGKPIIQEAICALPIHSFNEELLQWHAGSGLYFLLEVENVDGLAAIITSKLQTLSYWGIKRQELLKLVSEPSIQGIDRIVPVGKALEFSVVWDGVNLLSLLSNQLTLEF